MTDRGANDGVAATTFDREWTFPPSISVQRDYRAAMVGED